MKKHQKIKPLTKKQKAECANSVEAYFARIGPLGADLMPIKKEKRDVQDTRL